MRIINAIVAGLAGVAMLYGAASAALTGYIKIPDIDGESQRATVGGAQTQTIGAAQSQTVKGGQAVIVGALWNGGAPKRGKPGTVTVMIVPGALSQSLSRLEREARTIPSLTLTVTENGKTVEYKLENCIITSWSTSGDAGDRPTEQVAFYYNRIAFKYASSPDGR